MEKRRHHNSTMERARKIRHITAQHYEPGNQARCYKAVWRRQIYPSFKICYRTYLSYLCLRPPAAEPAVPPFRQLTLWDAEDESPAT